MALCQQNFTWFTFTETGLAVFKAFSPIETGRCLTVRQGAGVSGDVGPGHLARVTQVPIPLTDCVLFTLAIGTQAHLLPILQEVALLASWRRVPTGWTSWALRAFADLGTHSDCDVILHTVQWAITDFTPET